MILVFGKVSKSLLFLCLAVNFSYCLSCGLAQPQFLPPSHCLSCIRSQISFRLLAYWKVLKAWTVLKKKKKLLSGIWQWIQPDFKLFHFSWGSLNLVVISNLALCSLSQLFLDKTVLQCNYHYHACYSTLQLTFRLWGMHVYLYVCLFLAHCCVDLWKINKSLPGMCTATPCSCLLACKHAWERGPSGKKEETEKSDSMKWSCWITSRAFYSPATHFKV